MAARIVVNEGDIVVTAAHSVFGKYPHRSEGELVSILGGYDVARLQRKDGTAVYREVCGRCGGKGDLPHYAGIFGGTCFDCLGVGLRKQVGDGTPQDIVKVFQRRALARDRAAAKRAAAAAAERAAHAAWQAANPDLMAKAAQVVAACEQDASAFDGFTLDLANQAHRKELSAKQIEAFDRAFAEDVQRAAARRERAAASGWLGEAGGKVQFTGKVVYVNHDEFEFHGHTRYSTRYVLVGDNGDRVMWKRSGYHPAANGDMLTVKATIKELEQTDRYGKTTVITRGTVLEAVPAG